MKTNQEIIAELQTRGRFKTPEEVDQFFLKTLEAKDKACREDMIELVESIPLDWIFERQENCDCGEPDNCKWTVGWNRAVFRGKNEFEIWKAERLNKLKND